MEESNPARVYAGVIGATLVVAGIIGFFYNADFNANQADHNAALGVLDVNGWHNVVHIATGLVGLIAFMAGNYASRGYALALGVVYSAIAVWGFIIGSGDSILGFVPVNTFDNFLHATIGLLGLAVAGHAAFGIVAVAAMVFGILIPGTVTADNDSTTQVAHGRELFIQVGCRNCHTLGASGSLGTIGPNLDKIKPDEKRVLNAIKNGGLGTGSMPAGLTSGKDAQAIAAYIASATGATSPAATGGPPGKQIFTQNCGSCHTLADAGTSGTVGPNLDDLKPSEQRVLAALKNGGVTGKTMPKNIVTGKQAQQVAEYVAKVAGKK